jgi:acyl carrier protein
MSVDILAVGLAGELPPGHPHADLAARAADRPGLVPLVLPPALHRERKARVIVQAAHRALAGASGISSASLARCALVVVTRYDGQPTNKVDPDTNTIISFAEMAPTTVAFSFVSHMATSCVPHLLGVRGPAVTLAAREGLPAAWRIAERWLGRLADLALVIESDLALPAAVSAQPPVCHDYALAVLIGKTEKSGDMDQVNQLEQVKGEIRETIKQALGVEVSTDEQHFFMEAGIDSLAFLNVVQRLEKKFPVKFANETLPDLTNCTLMATALLDLLAKRQAVAAMVR